MICEKTVKRFCCEDISLIENYESAVKDTTQTWCCHHRRELDDGVVRSIPEMKELGLYFQRPCCELIFLPPFEHKSIHKTGNRNMLGKHHSEETKRKIGEAKRGNTNVRGMSWWHKGNKTKRSFSCPGDGWVRGRRVASKSSQAKKSSQRRAK